MTLHKFVFKTHKWLAVGTLIATLAWFVSGILMVTPVSWFGSRPFYYKGHPDDPALRDVAITVAQALATVDAATGSTPRVDSVLLRRLAGRVVYQVSLGESGAHLVDAITGEHFTIDEEFAKHIVRRHAGEDARFRQATQQREHSDEYPWGPLPAWRIALEDSRDTLFFIGAASGEVTFNDRQGRIRQRIIGWHSFAFLHGLMSERGIRITMWVFSIVGTAMGLFGCWILWIQWKNWLAARRARST